MHDVSLRSGLNASQTKVFAFRPSSLSPLLPHLTGRSDPAGKQEEGEHGLPPVATAHVAHAATHRAAEELCSPRHPTAPSKLQCIQPQIQH